MALRCACALSRIRRGCATKARRCPSPPWAGSCDGLECLWAVGAVSAHGSRHWVGVWALGVVASGEGALDECSCRASWASGQVSSHAAWFMRRSGVRVGRRAGLELLGTRHSRHLVGLWGWGVRASGGRGRGASRERRAGPGGRSPALWALSYELENTCAMCRCGETKSKKRILDYLSVAAPTGRRECPFESFTLRLT